MFKDELAWPIAAALAACLMLAPVAARAEKKEKQPGMISLPPLVEQAYQSSKSATTDPQFTEVIRLCRQALGEKDKLNPQQTVYARKLLCWAYNQRGELRAEAGQSEKALADFDHAVSTYKSWRAIHNRGVSYADCGKVKEALADFEEVIRLKPDFGPVWYNRGELHSQQGDYPAAIADYGHALEVRPKDSAALSGRGYALYQLGKYGMAMTDFNRSLELNPKQTSTLIYRAAAHYEMGSYAQAADDCRAAVRLDASSAAAYQATAWLMATCPDQRFRESKLAVKAARKAVELRGANNYRDLEVLAAALASDGQYQLAADTQRQAIAALPPNQSDLAADFKNRLKRYQHNQPYRETRIARPTTQTMTR